MKVKHYFPLGLAWVGGATGALGQHLGYNWIAIGGFLLAAFSTIWTVMTRQAERSKNKLESALIIQRICMECVKGVPPQVCPLSRRRELCILVVEPHSIFKPKRR